MHDRGRDRKTHKGRNSKLHTKPEGCLMQLIFRKSVAWQKGIPQSFPGCRRPYPGPGKIPTQTGMRVARGERTRRSASFHPAFPANFSVDTQFYPLGSCTMKYNPKFNERIAQMPDFAGLHPLLPQLKQGKNSRRERESFTKWNNCSARSPDGQFLRCSRSPARTEN